MMLDTCSTIVAGLMIAAAGPSRQRPQLFRRPSPAEVLSGAAERRKQLLAALRNYTYYSELVRSDGEPGRYDYWKVLSLLQISFDRDGNRLERVLENTSTAAEPGNVNIGRPPQTI